MVSTETNDGCGVGVKFCTLFINNLFLWDDPIFEITRKVLIIMGFFFRVHCQVTRMSCCFQTFKLTITLFQNFIAKEQYLLDPRWAAFLLCWLFVWFTSFQKLIYVLLLSTEVVSLADSILPFYANVCICYCHRFPDFSYILSYIHRLDSGNLFCSNVEIFSPLKLNTSHWRFIVIIESSYKF